jgi:hypothetical protein
MDNGIDEMQMKKMSPFQMAALGGLLVVMVVTGAFTVLKNSSQKLTSHIPRASTNTLGTVACDVTVDIATPTITPTLTPTPPVISCNNVDINFVMDRSTTMGKGLESNGDTKLSWAKEAVASAIGAIKSNNVKVSIDSFGAQGFGDPSPYTEFRLTSEFNSTLDVPLTTNYSQAISEMNSKVVFNSAGTCIECGLRIGNNLLATETDPSVKKVLILLSDGMANHSWDGYEDPYYPTPTAEWGPVIAQQNAINEAIKGRNSGIEYHVIGYGGGVGDSGIDENTLKAITGPTGVANGFYIKSPSDDQWKNIFLSIIKDVCK